MAKPDPKKELELHPDGWARFERAVDVVAKSPPQHRAKAAKRRKRKNKSARSANVSTNRAKDRQRPG
jgi:hypothetical protein